MAKRSTSVALSEHHQKFIQEMVDSGRYGSASEVVRDALRLAEERAARIKALDAALMEGEESGPAVDFDLDSFLAEMRANYSKNAT
ncbi:type II toxin-antitoxin system ParD family antitoxin [Alterisphingorhabdus coralli]|uniref:Type II toxin-antitoxin system ParD family antitoxin n=1 Tax=Alterisphingorhabdus coralli TaxID=3071408 RepID=A0AA97I194_9SPHN|nr:type II toxin-antitoxin system ParD family antitoxin [Parasphingorhabdus sp. SCSIO 66989]WOE76504.1 type II toxin-antitoxin system ParD family antitoxin [Parasphingorhabdus sp. SCSIO 66989]